MARDGISLHCSSMCPFLSSFAPDFFPPSSLFSLMCTFLASGFRFCSRAEEFVLCSHLTHSTTTRRTISDNLCTVQILKYANLRTSRCCRLALLHPLRWSASASFLLLACAPGVRASWPSSLNRLTSVYASSAL